MSGRPVCVIKVIQNANAESTFTIKAADRLQKLYVKIIVHKPESLVPLAENIEKFLINSPTNYELHFNWDSASVEIRKNEDFRRIMYKIFQSNIGNTIIDNEMIISPEKIRLTAQQLKKHIETYGNSPDFHNQTPKNQKKIHNFIKTVLGMPNITRFEVMNITKTLLELI